MNYSYETRDNETYIVTDKKYNKDTIILKLNNVFKRESLIELLTKENYTATWKIKSTAVEDKLEIELKIEGGCNISNTFTKEIYTKTVLNEFVTMMRIGGELESCSSFIQTMTEIFNEAFYYFACERRFIFVSDYIIQGYVEIKGEDNKALGGASRFKILPDGLYIYEYIGKEVPMETIIKTFVYLEHTFEDGKTLITKLNFIMTRKGITTLAENNKIEYFEIESTISGISTINEDMPNIPEMNYTYVHTSADIMRNKFLNDNTEMAIMGYKNALKPKVKLININKYMINEFTV